jgi:hypothetical protein
MGINALTIRQRMVQMLTEGEYTARDLSQILHIREKEVYEHLPHVQRSLGNTVNLMARPPACLECGFVFNKRTRLTTPGRCPVCRAERISEPVFGISS